MSFLREDEEEEGNLGEKLLLLLGLMGHVVVPAAEKGLGLQCVTTTPLALPSSINFKGVPLLLNPTQTLLEFRI